MKVYKRVKPAPTGNRLLCLFGISFENYLNDLLTLSVSLLCLSCVSLRAEHRYRALVAGTLVEVNHTVGQGIQSIVLALCHILAWEVLVATLANNDVAGNNLLATPNLNT